MRSPAPTHALRRLLFLAALAAASLLVSGSALAQAPGELTQKPIPDGCISQTGTGGSCEDGTALDGARRVSVSPDGENVYAVSLNSDSVVILDRDPDTGEVDQKPGTTGCISNTGAGPCVDGRALNGASGVAVSPDGENVYVASIFSDAVAIFDRDQSTGALTQPVGTGGCIDDQANEGCLDGRALNGAFGITLSPAGDQVYVGSSVSDAVAVLQRNTGTGALTQAPGTDGCIDQQASEGCLGGRALNGARAVSVSSDGDSVYAASSVSDAVAVLDRAGTGLLSQPAGTAGCVDHQGGEGCADGRALDGAGGVVVAPGDLNVYVASIASDAVAVFDRSTATGGLTQKGGAAGCVDEQASEGCADGRALDGAISVTTSPGGGEVYVASQVSDGIAILDRDATNGELTQKPGQPGCVTNTGTGGTCQDGLALNNLRGVAVSPNSRSVYGAALTDDAVSVFDRSYPEATITGPNPGPVAFGERATASGASDPMAVTLTSTGTADVTFDTTTITGPDASEFSIAVGGCAGTTVDPGATCTIEVTFDPATVGDKTATLEVGSNGQGSPQTIALAGTGTAPGATITDPAIGPLDLGDQPVGEGPGPARLVTVTSTGGTPVTFGSLAVAGAPDGQFLIGGNCANATLAPGQSCRVGVSFDPTVLGPFAATLEIRSDDPGSPATLSLMGTGVPAGSPTPAVDLNQYRALSGGQCTVNASVALQGPEITGAQILFGPSQLETNQQIGQAAIRRLNGIQAWLEAGIEGRDIRGGVLGIDNFGAGVEWQVGSLVPIPPVNPRPIDVAKRKGPGDRVAFTLQQLIINQRVYQEAIARVNALEARIDGMLTGGDVVDGSIGQGRLLPGLRIATLTPVASPSAPSRTNVKKPQRGQGEEPQFSSTQLVTNQRIATTAVARTNTLIERIESGLDACSFVPGSLTGDDLTPLPQAA